MLNPTHRYLTVRDLIDNQSPPPADSVMADLYTHLTGGTGSPQVAYAWDLFKLDDHRAALDAFFLVKAPTEVIGRVLDIPVEVLNTYSYLFMDMSALRNRLEILSFAAAYEGPASGKEMIRAALTIGLEYLLWTHGMAPELDSRVVVRRTMTDSFYRGMAHKGNSLATDIAREAHKWWATAIRNAELLERIDPRATQDAYNKLRIALEGHDDTLPPEKSPVSISEVLH